MKNITEQFSQKKIKGIYRIFIKAGKYDFCYVSYSENILGSIKEHRNTIQKHFKGSQITKELLKNYSLPENNKSLFQFSIFLVAKLNGLNDYDIKYEVLEETDVDDEIKLDEIEQKWINEFQCEKYGFNSAFKYLEKFVNCTMKNMEGKIDYYKNKWIKAQIKIEDYAAHDQRHINKKKWYRNPTNAFLLLDRGYIKDESNWFKNEWKAMFDEIKKQLP